MWIIDCYLSHNCKSRTIYHECIFGYTTPTLRLISKDCHHEVKKYYDLFHCLGFKFENSTSLKLLWRYLAMFALILQKALLRKDERACYCHYYQKIKNIKWLSLSASMCHIYLICQCSEYDDSRASIELSYGCTGAAPVNWTPENTNTPASRIVSAETESIMPLYLIAG